jgi:arylsulfatase A-like enzyme
LNNNGRLKTYGDEPRDYSTDVYAGLAERAIEKADRKGKPFFLNLAPNAPHTVAVEEGARNEGSPAVPAPRHADVFADAELPRYPNFNEEDISDKPGSIQTFFPNQMSGSEIDSLTDHYRGRMGSLLAVDDMVKRVVGALRDTGELKNTVIVFTSDNGWILGEHRLRDPFTEDGKPAGVKYVPYEGAARVPLMIAGPGFPEGRKVREVTVNADLAPTILRLTGARATLPQDGVSLRNAARRPEALKHRAVLMETGENPRVPSYTAIRTRRYRYDLQEDGANGLYDLKRDPWELQSVHDDPNYARIEAILARKLEALETCEGRSCRVTVGRLPTPGG